VAKEVEKVVILTGQVELVARRVGIEETTHHQRSRSAGFDLLFRIYYGLTYTPMFVP